MLTLRWPLLPIPDTCKKLWPPQVVKESLLWKSSSVYLPDDLEPEPLSLLTLSEIPAGRVKINSLGVITVDPEATYHMALKSTTPGSLKVVVNPLLLHAATLSAALYKLFCKKTAGLYLYELRSRWSADFSPALSSRLTAAVGGAEPSRWPQLGRRGRERRYRAPSCRQSAERLERSSYRYNPAALFTLHFFYITQAQLV